MDYFQAIFLGFLGSFHCAGMCGPIALALPFHNKTSQEKIGSALLYNTGRVFTYSLLGLTFGFLGFGLAFWGMQRWVSIGMGALMILSVVFPIIFRSVSFGKLVEALMNRFNRFFGKMFAFRSWSSVFFIGMLNGFLPCGLVYIALAGAIVSRGATDGAIYMALFGLGTIPMMFSVSMAGGIISVKFRNKARQLIPWVIVLIGILFIIRGLNLGIPYLSPELKPHDPLPDCCH
ncbi:MAG: sulfite exporter TauE/SafE family protein [Bacteroidota bacterium]